MQTEATNTDETWSKDDLPEIDLIDIARNALQQAGIDDHPVFGEVPVTILVSSQGWEVYAEAPGRDQEEHSRSKMARVSPCHLDGIAMYHFLSLREISPEDQTAIVTRDDQGVAVEFTNRSSFRSEI